MNNVFKFKRQLGMSFFGVMYFGGTMILLIVLGLKLFPAYSEYFSVKTAINSMSKEPLSTMSRQEIKNSFDAKTVTAYISIVSGEDLIVKQGDNGETYISVVYQVVTPVFYNVSVMLDFEASSKAKM